MAMFNTPLTQVVDTRVIYTPPRPSNMFSMSALGGGSEISLPNPDSDSMQGLVATLVNSGRNANAVVTAQKIGRDQEKITMTWNFLTKNEWERMIQFWDSNFFFNFTFYSPVKGYKITRECYVGDRTYRPFAIDSNGQPIAYVECAANVIDTGSGM